ncbi:MAG: PH domain-containing protein [archaeon]
MAYKCDKCGKDFKKKDKAEEHEKKCRITSSETDIDLRKREKIQESFGIHPAEYLGYYLIGGFLTITLYLAIIGIPLIIIAELVRRGHRFYITNQRIISHYQFLSKRTSSTSYEKIQDIHVTQNLIERMFKIGQVHVNTAGSNGIEMVFKGVKNPRHVKSLIDSHL